jgi:hypothetical protein
MSLKEGQQVLIKNPRSLVGTVLRERPGDRDLPEGERRYMVHIPGGDYFYLPSDLEPVEESSNTPVKYGAEWSAELARWVDAGQRWLADNNDRAAWDEFSESGSKLGFFVPIPK